MLDQREKRKEKREETKTEGRSFKLSFERGRTFEVIQGKNSGLFFLSL